jgi:GNAT superfamily N-acetyltransferase
MEGRVSMSEEGARGPVRIREAVPDDAPVILQLIRELANFERLSDRVVATEADLFETLFGEPPYATALLAERDGVPVGFLIYFNNYSTFLGKPGLYIEDIFVHSEERGEGVGRALLKYCAKLVKERGWGRMEFAVLDWNPARRFYEHFGATPMGDWIIYRLDGKSLEDLADS